MIKMLKNIGDKPIMVDIPPHHSLLDDTALFNLVFIPIPSPQTQPPSAPRQPPISLQNGESLVGFNPYSSYDHELEKHTGRFHEFYPQVYDQPDIGSAIITATFVMEGVEFVYHPGFRFGCLKTNILGFAKGKIVAMGEPSPRPLRDPVPIKFNGTVFINSNTIEEVSKATRIIFTKNGVYAQLSADPVATEPTIVEPMSVEEVFSA